MLAKRRLTVATVAVFAGASWAVLVAPGSNVAAAPADGTPARASVFDNGNQAPDGGNQSVISGDGRWEAFASTDDLDPDNDSSGDIQRVFVRDLNDPQRTVQISVSTAAPAHTTPNGSAVDADSYQPGISADGRYVSFVTGAQSIVGPEGFDFLQAIVVCDRDPDNDGDFNEPLPGDDFPTMRCVKVKDQFQSSSISTPTISGDGHELAWDELETNLSTDVTHDYVETVHLRDVAGQLQAPTAGDFHQLSRTGPVTGDADLSDPAVSADGHSVVYTGHRVDSPVTGIFETGLDDAGVPTATTRVDTDPSNKPGTYVGSAQLEVSQPAVSGDGEVVAYVVDAGGSPPLPQVYVSDPGRTTMSVTDKPTADPSVDNYGDGIEPALSADGRYVAFVTDQADAVDAAPPSGGPPNRTCINLKGVAIDDNTMPCQVVVRDLVDYRNAYFGGAPGVGIGFAQLASASIKSDCGAGSGAICVGDFDSASPSLSEHGAQVAFDSFADDLVPNDTNVICDFYCEEGYSAGDPAEDAFVRTWTRSLNTPKLTVGRVHVGSGKTVRYTITATGFGGQIVRGVSIARVTGDGFSVDDTGCGGGADPPFVLYQGQTCTVTVIFAPTAEGPVEGRLNVDTDGTPNPAAVTGTGTPPLPSNTRDIVRTSVGDGDPGTQGDGGTVCTGGFGTCEGSSMVSGDGRYDVFVSRDPLDGQPTRGNADIFVRDLRNHTTERISVGGSRLARIGPFVPEGSVANGDSSDPTISANGRLVVFLTEATNVVGNFGEDRSIVVLCDRDPDDDGVYDEVRSDTGIPDFRCFAVHNAYTFGYDQSPRISPDGTHLVYIDCPTNPTGVTCSNTDNGREQVVLTRVLQPAGGPVTGFTDTTPLVLDSFGTGADRNDPQVSNEGLFGDPHGVRVTYYTGFRPSAIWVVDVGNTGDKPHRIDVVPNGATPDFCDGADPCFLGDDPSSAVGEPSMTDDGSVVAFDRTNSFSAIARAYIADVDEAGNATTRPVAKTRNGDPVRAADPALSGDGRYISYVTDRPNFRNNNQRAPQASCLVSRESDFLAVPAGDGYTPCQIVARDLVLDAQRSSDGLDPLPDALVTESLTDCGRALTVFGSTCGGDNDSLDPSMSRNGSEVGFDSYADDLVAKDTNPANGADTGGLDAFVRTFYPTATLSPVNFGNVPVGSSSSETGTLTVTGFGPYQLADATVGGANPGDFTVTGGTCALPGQVLHLGEMCDLTFTFTPGGSGPRSGTVTVSGENNPNTTTITVTGDGTTTTKAMFFADPNPVKFGSGLPLDKPGRTRTVTITNGGGSPLVLSQVSVIDGSVPDASHDYTVDLTACNFGIIPPGESCKIKVTWVGHAVGPRPAMLRFVDNAPGGLHLVGLRANVPAPVIKLTPRVVPTGRLTAVTGKGFAPKRNVRIFFPDSGETATGRTSSHGNFSAPLIIFPNGILGHRMVEVRSAHADKSISATKPLLVVLGTLQSPTLVIRH